MYGTLTEKFGDKCFFSGTLTKSSYEIGNLHLEEFTQKIYSWEKYIKRSILIRIKYY